MQRTYQFFIFIAIFALSFQPLKGAGLLFSRETPQTYLDLFRLIQWERYFIHQFCNDLFRFIHP